MGIAPSASDDNCSQRNFSSSPTDDETASASVSSFAAIDHSKAYESSMQGRHGQQLALARLEGLGKDDLPFDPFAEEEQRFLEAEEEKNRLEAADGEGDENDDSSDSDDNASDDDSDSDDDDDDIEEEDHSTIYNRDGSIRRKKSVLATLKAGYPSGGLFAVIELAGSQHKVTTDDLLAINKLKPVEDYKVGSVHTLKDVLMVGSSHLTLVGLPHVTGAEVDVMIEEITQDEKVIIFKKRRRKHSQRKNGFRRDLALVRVLDIRLPEGYKEHDHIGRDSVDELETVSLTNGATSSYDGDASHFDVGNQISEGEGQKI